MQKDAGAKERDAPPDAPYRNLRRRLHGLWQYDYLHRFRTVIGGEQIYALHTKGAQLLLQQQLSLPLTTSTNWREKNRIISNLYADHALMVARFRCGPEEEWVQVELRMSASNPVMLEEHTIEIDGLLIVLRKQSARRERGLE